MTRAQINHEYRAWLAGQIDYWEKKVDGLHWKREYESAMADAYSNALEEYMRTHGGTDA